MREQSTPHFVGLDIGTQTVRVVVGTIQDNDDSRLSIVGHGSAPNLGMRKGVIVHVDDVVEAVTHAITEAERVSGFQIRQATVNVNGSHIMGMNSKGVIAISAANKEITPEDRLRVEEASTIVNLAPNREIIQVFARNYRLDGQDNIKDPIGMHGVRLEVDTHIVTALTPNLYSLNMVLDRSKVEVSHRTVSSLAAAEAVMTRQQKEAGTLLLDIGAGTTNLTVIEDGEVNHVAVIPVGGINITNDLAIGLKTDLDIAEKVKIEHASLLPNATTKPAKVSYQGKEYLFESGEIKLITEARVEELLELVDKELKKIQKSRKLPGGVVIVGGTAKLPGIAELAREKLELAARIGELQPLNGLIDTVADPSYSTAVGLMLLDMLLLPAGSGIGEPNKTVFGMVEGLLRRVRTKSK